MTDEPDASRIGFRRPDIDRNQKETITKMPKPSKNDYTATVSDNVGIVDAPAEVLAPKNLLMDMLADPEFVEESVQRLLPVYKQTQEELFSLLQGNNQSHAILWQLWAPKRLVQMQCDLSILISNEMFNRFVIPELEELTSFLDYHLYRILPVFQRMQKAGKCLVMKVEAHDVEKLLDSLSARGLQLIIPGIKTPEEANEMMKPVEKHFQDRG